MQNHKLTLRQLHTHNPCPLHTLFPLRTLNQMESSMDSKGHRWLAGPDSIIAAAMTPLGRLGVESDWNNQTAGLTLSAGSSLLRMRSLSRPSPDLYRCWTKSECVLDVRVCGCKLVGALKRGDFRKAVKGF